MINEEIKAIVKENGRKISDNSLRLMKIDGDIENVKKDVEKLVDINLEIRKNSDEIKLLLEMMVENNKNIVKDVDNLKRISNKVWGNGKVGVM